MTNKEKLDWRRLVLMMVLFGGTSVVAYFMGMVSVSLSSVFLAALGLLLFFSSPRHGCPLGYQPVNWGMIRSWALLIYSALAICELLTLGGTATFMVLAILVSGLFFLYEIAIRVSAWVSR